MIKMKPALVLFIVIFQIAYCQDTDTTTDGYTTTVDTTTVVTTTVDTTTIDTTTVDTTTTDTTTVVSTTVDTTTVDTTTIDTTTVDTITPDTTTVVSTTVDTTTVDTTTVVSTTVDTTTVDTTTVDTTTEDTTTVETTTSIPVLFLSDDNSILSWSPRSTQSVIIEAPEGYKIAINVTECIIDGENGDYATIRTDEDTNGLLFTYGVERKPSYLYNNNRLLGEFFGTNASNFTAIFTRIGEPLTTTTTEIPTTTIILPTPTLNDSSTYMVYLGGRPLSEYTDPINTELFDALRDSIGVMAAKYCQNENFPLNGSITSDNVIVNHLLPCQLGWPNTETCVRLNFSVPVNLIDNPQSIWTGYQMTTNHLRIMWARYASVYLPDGVRIYTPPGEGSFKWWIVILLVSTLLFAIILLVIRHYAMKVSKIIHKRRKLSDTTSIISASDRNSQISLPPHYLQDTPALFENAYPMYNPEKTPEYSEPSFAKQFPYPGYQDLEQRDDEDDDVEESGA